MGIVIKQSSISSAITYTGTIIGFINTVYLFPRFLTTEEVGLMKVIPNIAFMVMPLAQVGLAQSLVKFFPEISKKKNGLGQFTFFIFLATLLGCVITGCLMLFFSETIMLQFRENAELLTQYFFVVIILIFVLAFYTILEAYSRASLKIIALNTIKELLVRLLMSLAVSLYFLKHITFDQLVISLIGIYSFALIGLLSYLIYIKAFKVRFSFSILNRAFLKKLVSYSGYMIIGSSGSYIIFNLDQVMVSAMIGLNANGVYTTAFFFGVMIELPKRAINQIVTPIISRSFNEGKIDEIKKLYRATSINQLIIGFLVFIGITCNIDSLYSLMPNGEQYAPGKSIIFIIGLAKLIDMSFGNNSEIIAMSKYFRFIPIATSLLIIMMIVFNLYLIPLLGMEGAAVATLSAIMIYNLVKLTFIYKAYSLIPFSMKTLHVIGIGTITFLLGYYTPHFDYPILDIIIRSLSIILFFSFIIHFSKVSEEITTIGDKVIALIKSRS